MPYYQQPQNSNNNNNNQIIVPGKLDLDTSAAEQKLRKLTQDYKQITSSINQSGGNSYNSGLRASTNSPSIGSVLSGGGLGGAVGGASLAAASALAAGIAAVGKEFNNLRSRASELASTASNASSQLGQLRSSMERNSISSDIAATSPGVVGFQKFVSDLGTNLADAISHATSGAPDRAKALQEKLVGGLGQGNEDWRRLKEQGTDLLQDQDRQRTALQVKWQRQERDFSLQQRQFQVDTQNQVFDLQKQASRTQFDNQVAITKYQENFANQQSAKAYDLSRQFAAISFGINQSRSFQNFSISKGDQSQDFSTQMQRAKEDRQFQLQDMAMSGASGLDYLRSARQFNVGVSRAQQDFDRQQGRENRDFGISQQRAGQDYNLQNAQAQASRQLEIESQEYARKYEGLELQTQINRSSEDLAISFQRLNQSIGFQKEGLANRASDMGYDKNLDYSNFGIQPGRQNRNYGYALADFAGNARAKDPLGAAGLGSRDASFAAALAENARQSGQTDLFSQVNGSKSSSDNSWGAKIGDEIHQGQQFFDWDNIVKAWNGLQAGLGAAGKIEQARRDTGKGSIDSSSVNMGNKTYNFDSGMGSNIQQQIQDTVDKGDADTINKILEILRRNYSG